MGDEESMPTEAQGINPNLGAGGNNGTSEAPFAEAVAPVVYPGKCPTCGRDR